MAAEMQTELNRIGTENILKIFTSSTQLYV